MTNNSREWKRTVNGQNITCKGLWQKQNFRRSEEGQHLPGSPDNPGIVMKVRYRSIKPYNK